MKKFLIIAIACLSLLMLYVGVGPYLVASEIKESVIEKDSEKLSKNIEFPLLRKNIKEQLNAVIMKQSASELEENIFIALALTLATTVTDKIVDSFITPSGLSQLMEGGKNTDGNTQKIEVSKKQDKELFKEVRYTYDSLDKFSVWSSNYRGEEIRFILRRNGLVWKLVNIEIPMSELNTLQLFKLYHINNYARTHALY